MKNLIAKLNYQPHSLTIEELNDPSSVMMSFFKNHPIHEIRENIWQLYKGLVSETSVFASRQSNVDVLFFYSQLIDFINASYLHTEERMP